MNRLIPLAPQLWTANDELILALGIRFPVRMTVLRDGEGNLALWSPIAIDDALASELAELGTVRWLVAPNLFHHLYLSDAVARYPGAELVGVRGFGAKRPDLPWSERLLHEGLPIAGVEVLPVEGAPKMEEAVLFHRESGTLVVTDLVFAVREATSFWDRVVFGWVAGTLGRVGQSRLWRWSLTRDRAAAGASVRRMLELPFDRLVMAHGEVVSTGGRAALEEACAWMLAAPPLLRTA